MDKSLKVGEDEWWESERRGMEFMPQLRSEISFKCNFSNDQS